MPSQENKQTPMESMEYVFAEPHDADMYMAYALRALVHEVHDLSKLVEEALDIYIRNP